MLLRVVRGVIVRLAVIGLALESPAENGYALRVLQSAKNMNDDCLPATVWSSDNSESRWKVRSWQGDTRKVDGCL